MCKSSPSRKCLHCGTEFEVNKYQHQKQRCSRACNNAGRSYEYQANAKFKTLYGITLSERNDMFAEQDGKCLVCDRSMTLDSRKPNSAHVDHCHTTGEVKGLLCSNCNTAAGLLGENPAITAKLTAYLLDTAKVPTR